MKLHNIDFIDRMRDFDRGVPVIEQMRFQTHLNSHFATHKKVLDKIIETKHFYDEALISGNYKNVHYCIYYLDQLPQIMCSGATNPYFDFKGEKLQDRFLNPLEQEHITFSIIADKGKGVAAFSWLGESKVATRLVHSLQSLTNEQLPHALVRFAFEYFENTFASPVWWHNLNPIDQKKLLHRAANTTHKPSGLIDDNIRVVNWKILTEEANV